jgi:carboxymethylenebutenolidase
MHDLLEATLRIPVGTRSVNAMLFSQAGAHRRPGILLLMEFCGVRSWLLEDARDLAAESYAVLVPDLYSDLGRLRFCIRQFFHQAGRTNANETRQEALREVFAILEHLKTLPAVDAERLGALGQCLTGGFALHLARRSDVKAPVVYHHSLGVTGAGIDPADAAEIRQVIQGHFVQPDPFCPRARQERLCHVLGERLDYHLHPGVGHGLRSVFRNTVEGRLTWQQTKEFFAAHLKTA